MFRAQKVSRLNLGLVKLTQSVLQTLCQHCFNISTPYEGWGRGGIPRRPNSQATPQGLDQGSKLEVMPKMARWRSSDSEHSKGS